MKDYTPDKIRNIALVGHGASGKTSLAAAHPVRRRGHQPADQGRQGQHRHGLRARGNRTEDLDQLRRLLLSNGRTTRSTSSTRPGIPISSGTRGPASGPWTRPPCCVDAVAGVEVGTEKVWEMLEEYQLPRVLVINKMDRENAHFGRAVEAVQQFFGRQAIPVQIPASARKRISAASSTSSTMKAYLFEKDESGKFAEAAVPAEVKDEADKRYRELVEMIAESDEKLMENYLDKGELSPEEILARPEKGHRRPPDFSRLRRRRRGQHRRPALLDRVIEFLPSPVDRARRRGLGQRPGRGVQADPGRRRSPPSSSRPFPTPTPAGSR